MPNERRHPSGADKMAILREHFIEKIPVSDVCAKHNLQPSVFYQWQKKLFEEGAAIFDARAGTDGSRADARKVAALEAKLVQKNEVLAELMGEHVSLKKSLGQI